MKEDKDSWLDQARKLAEYRREALGFIGRAGKQFPVAPEHAKAVSRLWIAADEVDDLVCGLLEEMNRGLLGGKGELDTTRGAAVRPHGVEETLFYDCTWSLLWNESLGVFVNLAIEPQSEIFVVRALALRAEEEERLPFPTDGAALKSALARVYAAEMTIEDTLKEFLEEAQ